MEANPIQSSSYSSFDYAKQGMEFAERKLKKAAASIASGEITGSNMVELIEAKHMYTANAQVVRTQDGMLGSLLDVAR